MASNLKFDVDLYNIELAPDLFTLEEARAEYNRLRNIANKRLWNLRKSAYSDYEIVRANIGKFGGSRYMTEGELYKHLQDVARFVNTKTSSVTGIKQAIKKELGTLHDHGYDFVTADNVEQFREFWAEIKAHHDTSGLDSEQVADLFELAKKRNVDPTTISEAFQYWMEHTKEIKRSRFHVNYEEDEMSAAEFQAELESRKAKREARKAKRRR